MSWNVDLIKWDHWIKITNYCLQKCWSVCSLKGSLYRGRELLNQGLDFQVSSTFGGGEREYVSGLGSCLSSTNEKGLCLAHM